jgi:hypothetical protein
MLCFHEIKILTRQMNRKGLDYISVKKVDVAKMPQTDRAIAFTTLVLASREGKPDG